MAALTRCTGEGGILSLTRRTGGGGGVGADETHRGGGGGVGADEACGGGLALRRHRGGGEKVSGLPSLVFVPCICF